jgi:hypothetical protein
MQEHPTVADDLLRGTSEIAGFIGFSRKRTARLLNNRQLPAFKIGRIWCMRKSTYTDWMNRREPIMPPGPPALSVSAESRADEPEDMADAEGEDVEVLTLPPGQYHQRRLLDGRVVLLRRGPVASPLRARERQFREIDQRRAHRQNLRLPREGC